MTIYEYLESIYLDFYKIVEQNDCLCDLRGVNFNSNICPDYSNFAVQLLYILRYHFGYAFEYELMYNEIINEIANPISVLSIGCGNGIDLWSLQKVIEKTNKRMAIEYTGIDAVDWNYKIAPRINDAIFYYKNDVSQLDECLKNVENIDVLFFPKSISELSKRKLSLIADVVSNKSDDIYILASYRANEYALDKDVLKFCYLCDCMKQNGFCITLGNVENVSKYDYNVGIYGEDHSYSYPDDAKELIRNLHDKCNSIGLYGRDCDVDCENELVRMPILKTGLIRYNIVRLSEF